MKHAFTVAFLGFALFACTSSGIDSKGGKMAIVIQSESYDALFDAATKTLDQLGLFITSSDRERGEIRAKSGVSAFSWGEYVSLQLMKMPEHGDRYRLKIQNDKAVSFNFTAKDWTSLIVAGIEEKLRPH